MLVFGAPLVMAQRALHRCSNNIQIMFRGLFRCASPIFMLIAYYLGFTNRKRKYFEEKTTATLKSKQTSIATVRNHLRTLASFPTPLIFHLSVPKGTQDWEFFWLRFWILCYFIVSYDQILRFCKKQFLIRALLGEIQLFRVVWN
jgi:hypothetical protein